MRLGINVGLSSVRILLLLLVFLLLLLGTGMGNGSRATQLPCLRTRRMWNSGTGWRGLVREWRRRRQKWPASTIPWLPVAALLVVVRRGHNRWRPRLLGLTSKLSSSHSRGKHDSSCLHHGCFARIVSRVLCGATRSSSCRLLVGWLVGATQHQAIIHTLSPSASIINTRKSARKSR